MIDCKEAVLTGRVRARRKLFQPAELDAAGGRRRVHLLDLSETGALASGVEPPPEASFVTLICGEMRRSARVVWVRGRRFGIRFVMPLSMAEVDAVLRLGSRSAHPTRLAAKEWEKVQ